MPAILATAGSINGGLWSRLLQEKRQNTISKINRVKRLEVLPK
jgi:hypothetical protein